MKKKPQNWHDKMVIVWVTPETRKAIQSMLDPKSRRKSADDVIQDAIQALKEKEK